MAENPETAIPENIFLVLDAQLFPVRNQSTSMGRHAENDLIVSEPMVSRYHAELRYEGEKFVVHDNDSRNGTFVNGERVQERAVASGDTITLGNTPLLFIDRSSTLLRQSDAVTGTLDENNLIQ